MTTPVKTQPLLGRSIQEVANISEELGAKLEAEDVRMHSGNFLRRPGVVDAVEVGSLSKDDHEKASELDADIKALEKKAHRKGQWAWTGPGLGLSAAYLATMLVPVLAPALPFVAIPTAIYAFLVGPAFIAPRVQRATHKKGMAELKAKYG